LFKKKLINDGFGLLFAVKSGARRLKLPATFPKRLAKNQGMKIPDSLSISALLFRLPEDVSNGCSSRTAFAIRLERRESGASVERRNNTLRQYLARFVRKTLSFSKRKIIREICLFLFLHRYSN
jgi:hypothetical protein